MATGEASYTDAGGTVYYDLTTKTGDQAAIDDALFFTQAATGSSGTGLIQAFVRTQATGDEAGYNTSSRPLAYDENSSPQFTKSLLLNQVPIIVINGVEYYEFRLDINQTNSSPLLSLNELKVYTSTTGTYSGQITAPSFTGSTTLVWDLDDQNLDGTDDIDNTVLLDYSLQAGSGKSDIFFYVKVSDFGGADPDTTYVVLYSEFGNTGTLNAADGGDIAPVLYGDYSSNDGFEEWSVSKELEGPIISGFKFHDENGNGLWDDGEEGLGGWKIDYTLTYKDGNGANAPTVTITGSTTTSDGTVDVDGDGTIDPAGFYIISVPLGAANNTQYTLTLTEVLQAGWSNTYDGDATANLTTTFTFSENNLTGNPSVISGGFGLTETMNFGNFELFDISGTKFTDENGDGDTTGDSGLGGVTIFIDINENGTYEAGTDEATTTAGDGSWSFTGLDQSYAGLFVYEVLPSGYVQTLGQAGYEITGTSGTDQTGLDFANFELFDISGTKFTDENGDGDTTGDSGLGGVTIFIDINENGTYEAGTDEATTTAGDGSWSFTGLDQSYAGLFVYEVLPSGYVQTLGQAGYEITGTSGTDQTGLDFANFELFDISGTKFTDENGDGDTTGDSGLGGVTIFIDINENGTYEAGTDEATTTAGDGSWSFTGLDQSYAGLFVYEVLPSGYVQTLGQAGYEITGTSGTDQTGLDFANFELFDISGTKFTDENGDGDTTGDSGLGGVTIFIDINENGTYEAGTDEATTTAGDGSWSFTGLDQSYAGLFVYEVLPSGYVQTLGQAGYEITGTSGTDQTGLDFANFELFDISGTKFTDENGDGDTTGDSGLGGVTIFIDINENGTYEAGTDEATTTAGDGSWSFTGLDQSYAGLFVYEVLPSGYVQTLGQAGYEITGTSGTDQTGLDFANFLPDPSIDIEKSVKTNLFDFLPEDGDDDPDGLLAGTSTIVTFKVVVTNTGNETLSGIKLTDSVVHTVNGVPTSQSIVYTADGNPATLDAFNVFVDLDGNGTEDAGEAWSNFDTDGDGIIDAGDIAELSPDETFTLYYSLNSLLGQHENTGKVDATSAISNTAVTDSDDANYYVVEEDCVGVRTPGFWANNKWGQFWNFDPSKASTLTDQDALPQAGQPNFPGGELLYRIDTDKDGVVDNVSGLLVGDYNKNGITDAGEDTIYISLADAKALINASNKNVGDGKTADGIWMLGRDVVAAWLNYLANNPDDSEGNCIGDVNSADGTNSPREFLDAAIDWLQQFASDQNVSNPNTNLNTSFHDGDTQAVFQFDARIAPSSAAWQNPFLPGEDIPVSAAAMHAAIDGYNNTGTIGGIEYCCDADSQIALNALTQISLI